jgi:hypothetical protein
VWRVAEDDPDSDLYAESRDAETVTRVTVSAVLGQLAAGRSVEDVLADYPYLERADILAALERTCLPGLPPT